MTQSCTHILDDLALGGVVKALENFSHPKLTALCDHEIIDLASRPWADGDWSDTAILHFTLNWRKLPQLLRLRTCGRFGRLILIEHSYTEYFEKECVSDVRRFRMMLRLAYRLADKVVAVSEGQGAWMLKAGLVPDEKLVVIPQSRNIGKLLSIPPVVRRSGPLQLGAYGRFHQQKGFDLLIEAMSTISPDTCRLQIVGYGEDEAKLKNMAKALPQISFGSAFHCPSEFLQKVDMVAIPSRWEAFGLVGSEARAAGRPLIAAGVDGLRGQVGDHSWSYEAGNLIALRQTIVEAAKADDLTQRGFMARAHVKPEFDKMLDAWTQLFHSDIYAKAA